jgi:sec-independent protein translocase protein TatB
MFDIGFWELLVVGVVALVVIGPKDLPVVAHNIGRGIGKMRAYLSAMKSDLNYEIEKANELKRLMEKESEIAELHRLLKENAAKAAHDLTQSVAIPTTAVTKVEKADGNTPAEPVRAHTDQGPAQPVADRPKTE